MDEGKRSLEYLLNPVSLEEFFGESWEKQPRLIRRDDPDFFRGYFSMEAMDSVLTTSKLNPTDVRAFRAGSESQDFTYAPDWAATDRIETHGVQRRVDVERLYSLFEAGSTITLNQVADYWGPLAQLCREVESFLQCKRANCNAYLSPRASDAWGEHYDLDDVLVLQIDGEKVWRIYDSPIELPYRHQHYVREKLPRGELVAEWTLKPGDTLYVPRGVIHEPFTRDKHSLHVTISSFLYTWSDLIEEAVAILGDGDVRFRRALPFQNPLLRERGEGPRGIADTLAALVDGLKRDEAVAEALESLRDRPSYRPPHTGELSRLVAKGNIDGETLVRANRDVQAHTYIEADHLTVGFDGRMLQLPTFVKGEVEAMLATEGVRVRDLPGELDVPGKATLARRLVAEGLVRIAG